jgi:hypothetical protein
MDYFTIYDHSFESPEKVDTFKATILVINDRRIYADDFDDDDDNGGDVDPRWNELKKLTDNN